MQARTSTRFEHSWRAARYCMCVAILAATVQGRPLSSSIAKSGPDIALTDDKIIVAEANRGVILQGPLKSGRIPIAALAPIPQLSVVKRPVAIDARGSRIVVVDAIGPAVVDFNLSTGMVRDLLRGAPLREPTSVAIAAAGTVAVADPAARAVFLMDGTKEMQIERRATLPLQVEYDNAEEGLYINDAERGLFRVEYSSIDNFIRLRNSDRIFVVPLSGARVFSFAPLRGLVYVAEESGLRVAVPARRLSLAVPQQFHRRRFTAIALQNQYVAGVDEGGASVDVLDRPIPVSVTLDPDEQDPNVSMLAFLDYAAGKRLLPARGVPLEQPGEPYERVLARYKVLVPTSAQPNSPVDQMRLKALFCALNPRRCGSGVPEERPDEIAIPQLTIESYLAVRKQTLGGKTVEQHIKEKVVDPEQLATVTPDYLARINANVGDATLESELRRRNLVMPVPVSAALTPGTIVRINGNTEVPSGDLAQRCGASPERQTSSTYLPETITTRVLTALPDSIRAQAKAAGASSVQLGFDRVARSTIALAALRECRLSRQPEAEYLITESLIVDALRYRFAAVQPGGRGNAGRGAAPAENPYQRSEWSSITGPFVVAYKAIELSGIPVAALERAVDPSKLKPTLIETDALLQRRDGELNLPATHWRFDALVPAPDFIAKGSPLSGLRDNHPGLELSSHERLMTAARSIVVVPVTGALPPNVAEKLAEARKNLSKVISYTDEFAAGTEDIGIGIGEADDQVNQDHSGFIQGGISAWWQPGVEGWVRRPTPSQAGAASGEASLNQLVTSDHGTHVAGIVAARPSSLIPGLAPTSKLYLIDTAKNLVDVIQDAYEKADIRIFNFSFSIQPEQDLQALRRRMVQHWKEALFIVAAGNETENLNEGGSLPLISAVPEIPWILGVAAARADGQDVLGERVNPDDPTEKLPGSNFGSKYVQLAAPGENIHSLGDRQYAFASGTSQAVPQVTAAAAMLYARGISDPLRIKARLIATSDWYEQYKGKVWGGLLNVQRAVMHIYQNTLRTDTARDVTRAIVLQGDSLLTARDVTTYHPGAQDSFTASTPLPVRKIVRLTHLGGGKFRIIALDQNNRLTIMFAKLEGRIGCASATVFDETRRQFVDPPAGAPNLCAGAGIQVQQVHDYVANARERLMGVTF